MAFIKVSAFVLWVFLLIPCSLNAKMLLNNGSFDEDTATAVLWDSIGIPASIVSTYVAANRGSNPITVIPKDGEYFAVLESFAYIGEPDCTQLTQIIDVNAGECLTGSYFFDANDYSPFNDIATIKLTPIPEDPCSGTVEILLAQKSISDPRIQDYGSMLDWQTFSHTFDSNDAGRYQLVLIIENAIDHLLPSFLLVDGLKIVPGVPEPICNYVIAGDLNDDCKVNFADFAILAENWLVDCELTPNDPACTHK